MKVRKELMMLISIRDIQLEESLSLWMKQYAMRKRKKERE